MNLKLRKPVWKEKRESIRLELDCQAHFRQVETKWGFVKKTGKVSTGLMLKPSMNGMRLSTEAAIAPGTELEIEVEMQRLGFDRSYMLAGLVM